MTDGFDLMLRWRPRASDDFEKYQKGSNSFWNEIADQLHLIRETNWSAAEGAAAQTTA